MFEKPDNTPRSLAQAIFETLNFEYNGQQRSNVLAGDSSASQQGRQGSDGTPAPRERIESGEQATDDTGGTESGSSDESEGNVTENLSDEEIDALIIAMKSNASVAQNVEITDDSWRDNIETPIGNVKMGENQREKMFSKGRSDQYGMLLETLSSPNIVLEESDNEENLFHVRPSTYLFIKTFEKEDGSKYVHFESVTVSQDGMEVSVSSHIIRENQLRNKMKSDRLLYKATALDNSAILSAEQPVNKGGSLSSADKGSENSPIPKELGEKIAAAEAETNTNPTEQQNEATDAVLEMLADAGVEVVLDEKEMADVLEANEQLQEMKKSALGNSSSTLTGTEIIEKIRNSKSAEITGDEVTPSDDLKQYKKNALEYGKTLQGTYTNKDTGAVVHLQRGRRNGGINEVLQHDYKDVEHLQSIAAIPQIIENGIYIASEINEDVEKNPNVSEYQHFVCGLRIGGEDYTVRSVYAVDKNGDRYYDHKLTHIEKGKLLDSLVGITNPGFSQATDEVGFGTTPGTKPTTDVSDGKDKKLISLIKGLVSENSSPLQLMTVYHGSGAAFDAFDHSHMGEGEGAQAYGWGTYVTEVESIARTYAESTSGKQLSGRINRLAQHIQSRKDFIRTRKSDIKKNEDYEKYARSIRKNLRNNENEYKLAEREGNEKDMEFYQSLINIAEIQLKPENHKHLIDSFWDDINNAQEDIDKSNAEMSLLKKELKKVHRILYTVEIPEDNGSNYLEWNEEAPKELMDKINGLLEKNGKTPLTAPNNTGKYAYIYLMSLMPGESQQEKMKGASELLSKSGFVGIKYPAQYQTGGREDNAKNYVIFNEADAKITERIQFLKTGKGEVYGFVKNGKIYLDPKLLNPNTPIHEYTHIWDMALQKSNPELWARGVELMKHTSLWDEVKNNPAYADIANDDNLVASEVHARLTGKEGAALLERLMNEAKGEKDLFEKAKKISLADRLRRWINEAWQWVKDTMTPWTKEEADAVSLEEFVNMPIADLARGKKLGDISSSTVQNQIEDARDAEYMSAVERGDMEMAQRLVNEAAAEAGYSSDTSYQGSMHFNGAAPSSNAYFETKEERKQAWENDEWDGDQSLGDFVDSGIDNNDLQFTLYDPRAKRATTRERVEAIDNLRKAIEDGTGKIKVYRAVDANISEGSIRNGDWITPSKSYAELHIGLQSNWDNGGRIIEQEVSIDDIWWDGNDIAEWGYDDGKGYAYKNKANNRKLLDVITRDDAGNVIPLSKRFNQENEDVRYRADNQDDILQEQRTFLTDSEPVSVLSGDEFARDGVKLTGKVPEYYKEKYGGKVTREGLGDVLLDKESVKDSIAHGIGRMKSAAFAAVPEIIKHGIVIDERTNWKERQYDSITIAAPITIASERYVGVTVVKRLPNDKNRFYLHEVVLQKNLLDESIKTDTKADSHVGDIAKVLKNIFSANISKERLNREGEGNTKTSQKRIHKQMRERVAELSSLLGVEIEVIENGRGLEGKKARAKGWFDKRTGKISVVLGNHTSVEDIEKTVLHESVAHYGLRQLFGENFDRFLYNVFSNASPEVRREIAALMSKNNWDYRTATEEYLAGLAERTNFEEARSSGWWQKIKDFFAEMLAKAGFKGEISDNELRYVLWRSYENLKNGGINGIFAEAAGIATQYDLGVGEFEDSIRAVNERFNEQLTGLTEENADHITFNLGRPSAILRAAGVEDMPMKLYGSKVIKKMKKHGFSLEELRDLPRAAANPIAVFNNYQTDGNRSVLTELKTKQGNFLCSLKLGEDRDVDFNIITSVFGKGSNNIIVDWIKKGYATYINKEKARAFLFDQSAPIAAAAANAELLSAANIVENFENPSLDEENDVLYRQEAASPRARYDAEVRTFTQNNNVKWNENLPGRLKESYQDSMRALDVLQRIVAEESGSEIRSFENAYLAENAMSSSNKSQAEIYGRDFYRPLVQSVQDLVKMGADYEDIKAYVIAKHGLERNVRMATAQAALEG